MNVEIIALSDVNPIVQSKKIENTLFSVIKPEPITGTNLVLEKNNGLFVYMPYYQLTKSELKKGGYNLIHFVKDEAIKIDYKFILYSDLMEVLMTTILKCQIKITDHVYIVKNNIKTLSNEIAMCLNEQVNLIINKQESDVVDFINHMLQDIPIRMKLIDTGYATITGCVPSQVELSKKAKKVREKNEVIDAIHNRDLYDMAENEKTIKEMFAMNNLLNQNKVEGLSNENELYDILIQRYNKLLESKLIPIDMSMSEFIRNISKIDPGFDVNVPDFLKSDKNIEKKDSNDNQNQKAYFDE